MSSANMSSAIMSSTVADRVRIDVRIGALDMEVAIARDEEILTEISAKFTQPALDAELSDAGLELVDLWTDDDGDFALSLARLEQPPRPPLR